MDHEKIYVGTAGWAIRREDAPSFPVDGSHLERYADVFNMVEINSSFYRDHRPATYRKWSDMVPADFRFVVKLSRHFTHDARLRETGDRLQENLAGLRELGEKAGSLLVQLPPSLDFVDDDAARFFAALRRSWPFPIACEARHPTWTSPAVAEIFRTSDVAKVHADPERCQLEAPRVSTAYYRLHGSPEIYKSPYTDEALEGWAARIRADAQESSGDSGRPVFCVFDNTAHGFAVPNALALKSLIADAPPISSKSWSNSVESTRSFSRS